MLLHVYINISNYNYKSLQKRSVVPKAKPSVATTETIVTGDVKPTTPVFRDSSSSTQSQNMSTALPMTTPSTTKCPREPEKCAGYTYFPNICLTMFSVLLAIGYILVFQIV